MKALSDKQAAEIIKAMYGVRSPIMYTTSTIGDNAIISITPIGCDDIEVQDPRHDTNAALELLYEICERQWWILGSTEDRGWEALPVNFDSDNSDQVMARIPTAGESFRTAVCNLAVEVLGVAT